MTGFNVVKYNIFVDRLLQQKIIEVFAIVLKHCQMAFKVLEAATGDVP